MNMTKGKHYLIRQVYQYGDDKHDDIMVLRFVKRATEEESLCFGFESGFFGLDVRNLKEGPKFFTESEVISTIKI